MGDWLVFWPVLYEIHFWNSSSKCVRHRQRIIFRSQYWVEFSPTDFSKVQNVKLIVFYGLSMLFISCGMIFICKSNRHHFLISPNVMMDWLRFIKMTIIPNLTDISPNPKKFEKNVCAFRFGWNGNFNLLFGFFPFNFSSFKS